MTNVTDLQQAYLDQFIQRKSQALFSKPKDDYLKGKWHLVLHEKVSKELSVKCELKHKNGKTCNTLIQNIYTIESESGALLKVGSTCLNKVIPVSELDKIEKQAKKLKRDIETVNIQYPAVPKRTFTMEEKENILKRTGEEGILPEDIRSLLEQGVPLSDSVYNGLYTNLYNLEQNRKQMAEKKRQLEERRKQVAETNQLWKEKLPAQEKTPTKSQQTVYEEKLRESLEREGLQKIRTPEDTMQVCELGLLACIQYAPPPRMNVMRYSDVVREIGAYYAYEMDIQGRFAKATVEHAKGFLRGKGYRIFGENRNEFLFQL